MKYAGVIKNDFSAAPGVCLTFFTQGCPHRCKGCHNPETWDFDSGKEFTIDTLNSITNELYANGIKRNLCIMGGEPMCEENLPITASIVNHIKDFCPDIKIYIWTGYTYEQLKQTDNYHIPLILKNADVLIDGLYIEEERDITLPMRGSRNQRIINLKDKDNESLQI